MTAPFDILQKAIGVCALILFFGVNGAMMTKSLNMQSVLVNQSYFVMLGLTACAGYVMLANMPWRDVWLRHRRNMLWALGVGVVVTFVLCLVCPPDYRVLSDETNLLAVSRSMLRDRTIHNTTMSGYYLDFFKEQRQVLDKRPLLFPFLLSVVHGVVGYSWRNLFLLNEIVSAGFLAIIFFLGTVHRSKRAGLLLVLTIAAQPIYAICMTSGGFELLAMVWQIGLCWYFYHYMARPTEQGLSMLWMCALLLINTRYEGGLLAGFMMLGLAWHFKTTVRFVLQKWWLYALTLPLASPIVWQLMLKGSDQESGSKKPWSLAYVPEHFRDWVQANFGFDYYYPFATPLSYLSVMALLGLGLPFLWKHRPKSWFSTLSVTWIALGGVIVLQLLIYLCYHAGSAIQPYAVRYFLPTAIAMSLGLGVTVMRNPRFSLNHSILGLLIVMIAYSHIPHENKFMNTLELVRKTRRIYAMVTPFPRRETMIVVDRPGQYTVLDFAAISHDYLRENLATFKKEVEDKLYTNVIFIQDIDVNTKEPFKDQKIPEELPTQIVYEMRTSSAAYTRISKLILR